MKKLTTIFGSAIFALLVLTESAAAQQTEAVYVNAKEQEICTARQAEMMQYRNETGKKLKKSESRSRRLRRRFAARVRV